jgi:pyruvate dehydrogenase E2 component (dihydrolipoamide acetyltransferase)
MPSLGADMESGRVVKWNIKPGDQVKRGDIVAEVETQKGVIDVEIFESGEVTQLLVPEGDEVPVGTPLALLNGAGTAAHEIPKVSVPARKEATVASVLEPVQQATPVVATRRIRISPAARRLAEEFGLSIENIAGTGLGGAITRDDVRAAAEKRPVVETPDRTDAMREAIAAAMARSKREIPHYYLGTDIDLKSALEWLETENLKHPVTERLLPAVLFLKAVGLAIRDVPEMNGFWRDGGFDQSEAIHVGVAISLRKGGLVAPALHDVDKQSLPEIMAGLLDLVQRARTGKLKSSELSDPTITVSNLGEQGVGTVYGVIYPPQVALVGFGAIQERPWAEDGMLGVRPVVTATLSADHRASVGHRGGLFLARIAELLQKPEDL